ncbi:hypothetical protein IHE61_27110 [Streptomyces sp. GKU 257-1]|nr:hypothetical protein [Streptomyces sp. GKU 257-1]
MWAHTAKVLLGKNTHGEFTVDTWHAWGRRQGDWVKSLPGTAWDPRDGDALGWFRHVRSHAVISRTTGLQIGRSSHDTRDMVWNGFEDQQRYLDQITTFVHHNPVTGEYSEELPLPGLGDESDATHEDTHAGPEGQKLKTLDGRGFVLAGSAELRAWYRRKSVTGSWISIGGCSVGAYLDASVPWISNLTTHVEKPFVPDPLAEEPQGQRIANAARKGVRAAHPLPGGDETERQIRPSPRFGRLGPAR